MQTERGLLEQEDVETIKVEMKEESAIKTKETSKEPIKKPAKVGFMKLYSH